MQERAILTTLKPLYIGRDSGLHWYLAYLTHDLKDWHMTRSTVYTFLLMREKDPHVCDIVILEADDILDLADQSLEEDEAKYHGHSNRKRWRNFIPKSKQ